MSEIVHPNGQDIGLAIFGLASYIQECLKLGRPEVELFPHMQAYFNLSYRARGLALPDLHELRARKVTLSPEQEAYLSDVVWPSWLPISEKAKFLPAPGGSRPCTSGPGEHTRS